MGLTQYLESQEDQDMTKLLNFTIPSCKIYMVEEETLDGGPKGGGKKELGEEE